MKTLKGDDGTPLEIKQGVLLDRDGTPMETAEPYDTFGSGGARVRVWRGSWGTALSLAALIPLLAFAGFALFAMIAGFLLLIWFVRFVLGLFSPGARR